MFKRLLLSQLFSVILSFLNADMLRELADKLLDFIEERIDDIADGALKDTLESLMATIRSTFDIPDDD